MRCDSLQKNTTRYQRKTIEKKKRAAISAVGSDVTPRYRRRKRVTRNERLNAAGNTKELRAPKRGFINSVRQLIKGDSK